MTFASKLVMPAILALSVTAVPAWANGNDCHLTARPISGGALATYDPFSPVNTVITLDLEVRNNADHACNARFYVAPRDSLLKLHNGTSSLIYRVDGAHTGGSPLPNGWGPFNAHTPAHGTDTVHVQFTIQPQQIVPRGIYTSELTIAGIGEANRPVDVTGDGAILRAKVPSKVDMSISGTAASSLPSGHMAPASIDFGIMHTGDVGRVFVNVWSNGSVTISLDSANHGVLRHVANPALPPIPYSATFDGAAINLAGVYSAQRTPPASLAGASYPLVVTLGDVSHKFAGKYRDVITVNVNQN